MKRRRHSAEITLTASQITLLTSIIDSFACGRASRQHGDDEVRSNSEAYAAEDRFCEVLLTKLRRANEVIAQRNRTDEQLARVRKALLGMRKSSR